MGKQDKGIRKESVRKYNRKYSINWKTADRQKNRKWLGK